MAEQETKREEEKLAKEWEAMAAVDADEPESPPAEASGVVRGSVLCACAGGPARPPELGRAGLGANAWSGSRPVRG